MFFDDIPGEICYYGEEELPICSLPQLDPRLPRRQQHLQHPESLSRQLPASGGQSTGNNTQNQVFKSMNTKESICPVGG